MTYAISTLPSEGYRLPGELVADTAKQVRAMLLEGLTRQERTVFMLEGAIEM